MNVGSYRGAAALTAYEQWQEITAQNIASGSVPGFKKTDVSFACADGGNTKLSSGTGQESAGTMPKVSAKTNFDQGQISQTGNSLDFALKGSGFFQVKCPDGKMAYTRNGEFQLNAAKALTTKEGYPVMGESGPISLKGSGPIVVDAKGAIAQNGEQVGKVAVFNSTTPQNLVKLGGGMFAQADPASPLTRVATPNVVGSALESSNVAPLNEMVNLITVSRAYEANQKIIQTDDDSTDKAIQALGNPQA